MWEIRQGDALESLRRMDSGSVHCCVTSIPYWGLRDYGTATWEGGDPGCEHSPSMRGASAAHPVSDKQKSNGGSMSVSMADCPCGARRMDKQIGLEYSLEEYEQRILEVFMEVWRVLRDDGTLWLNIGDVYASGNRRTRYPGRSKIHPSYEGEAYSDVLRPSDPPGIKPKDLIGLPWRIAFMLQRAGWYLRSEIIWHKPACMPSSVEDRPTLDHEKIFLLAKRERYFYDSFAIREPASTTRPELLEFGPRPYIGGTGHNNDRRRAKTNGKNATQHPQSAHRRIIENVKAARANGAEHDAPFGQWRNKRSMWTVGPEPFAGAHFAVFPRALVRPCILAGTSAHGCCPQCGAPWERITERKRMVVRRSSWGQQSGYRTAASGTMLEAPSAECVGWQPGCSCGHTGTVPATVLDPFAGSGTTGVVAMEEGRRFIGIELNAEYIRMAERRLGNVNGRLELAI